MNEAVREKDEAIKQKRSNGVEMNEGERSKRGPRRISRR